MESMKSDRIARVRKVGFNNAFDFIVHRSSHIRSLGVVGYVQPRCVTPVYYSVNPAEPKPKGPRAFYT